MPSCPWRVGAALLGDKRVVYVDGGCWLGLKLSQDWEGGKLRFMEEMDRCPASAIGHRASASRVLVGGVGCPIGELDTVHASDPAQLAHRLGSGSSATKATFKQTLWLESRGARPLNGGLRL